MDLRKPVVFVCVLLAVSSTFALEVYLVNGGGNPAQGRVEVEIGGTRYALCHHFTFGGQEAEVICRQLGYKGGRTSEGLYGPPDPGVPYLWDEDIRCKGTEMNLGECSFPTTSTDMCKPGDPATGIQCEGVPVKPLSPSPKPISPSPSSPSPSSSPPDQRPTQQCSECVSAPSAKGYRRVIASKGVGVWKDTDMNSSKMTGLSKCQRVYWTGIKRPSTAGEDVCYAEVELPNKLPKEWGWVPLSRCGEEGANLGDDQSVQCCPKCSPKQSTGGYRFIQEKTGVNVLKEACAQSQQLTSLPRCTKFYWTGKKIPSSCGENICYAQVDLGAGKPVRYGWIQLQGCNSAAATVSSKLPSACQGPLTSTTKVPPGAIEFIKKHEGCYLKAYSDPPGFSIGYGTQSYADGTPVKAGDTIASCQEALELLVYKLEKAFFPAIKKIPYFNEWSPDMVSALLSFSYNLGAGFYSPKPGSNFYQISTVLRDKKWSQVPTKLLLYNKAIKNGIVQALPGLTKRRQEEGALWREGLSKVSTSYT